MANYFFKCAILLFVASQFLVLDTAGRSLNDDDAPGLSSSASGDVSSPKEIPVNYHLDTPHHIVKRKSKMGGRGFGFGKKKQSSSGRPKSNQDRSSYPKQPGQNPAYPQQPAHNPGYNAAPPAYPGTNSRPGGYPAGAPPPYSAAGARPGYPAGPPPAYPGAGAGHHNMPGYPPSYSQPGYGQPGYGYGAGSGGFMGKGYGNSGGFGSKGGGLGRTLGSAGFGAVAGTALGAYGGYKLGRMVGGLGRNGHYGYYDDHGKYMRCDPPREIKVDPETNVTYIPLDQDYDKRCHYYDRRPPPQYSGYTNGGGVSMFKNSPINRLVGGLLNLSLSHLNFLEWENIFALTFLMFLLK